MVADEYMMICIDNSRYMRLLDPRRYNFQLDCIRSYCRAKLKCNNPKTAIGIVTMGTFDDSNWLRPTSNLKEILYHLERNFVVGGLLDFKDGIITGELSLPTDAPNQKRLLFFTGGCVELDIQDAVKFGTCLKGLGVAVDVVNFIVKGYFEDSTKVLEAFVAAVDCNNNSNITHIQAELFEHHSGVMSRAPKIFPTSSLEEGRNQESKVRRGRIMLKMMLLLHML
ncbi:26S proteasome non-ATPase regulatory subunit 4 homolog [Rutidosis leptorrhynchoides]|uniref:26S proteasome non-ATPase regulatory subunit 4 homolog n=1 Tax=Rutidosis leptorrhynchoides TaxID=125765 RepID=UPI003A9A50E0